MESLERVHKSICGVFRVKWYTVPTTLRHACLRSMTVSPACDRCQQSPANLLHVFLLCPSLHNHWTEIFNTLSVIFGEKVKLNALSTSFGVFPSLPSLPTSKNDVLAFVTLLAGRLILTNWKSTVSSSPSHWTRDILCFLRLEKFRLY